MFDATLTHHYSMSMPGYTKLFNSILASTIWREDDKTRLVWITLLAMADKNGVAEGSIPGLADLARVSIEDCKEALSKLMSPDEYSRTTDNEGKRIKKVDGGWAILNHAKYRAKMSTDERREYNRLKQQEFRKNKASTPRQRKSLTVNDSQSQSALSAHTEAEASPLLIPSELKGEDFEKAWAEWADYRKQAKLKPYTTIGAQKQLSALAKIGKERAIAAINNSIANAYQGIYESNGTHRQNPPVNPRVAGTANANMCQQYAGVGRVKGTGETAEPTKG